MQRRPGVRSAGNAPSGWSGRRQPGAGDPPTRGAPANGEQSAEEPDRALPRGSGPLVADDHRSTGRATHRLFGLVDRVPSAMVVLFRQAIWTPAEVPATSVRRKRPCTKRTLVACAPSASRSRGDDDMQPGGWRTREVARVPGREATAAHQLDRGGFDGRGRRVHLCDSRRRRCRHLGRRRRRRGGRGRRRCARQIRLACSSWTKQPSSPASRKLMSPTGSSTAGNAPCDERAACAEAQLEAATTATNSDVARPAAPTPRSPRRSRFTLNMASDRKANALTAIPPEFAPPITPRLRSRRGCGDLLRDGVIRASGRRRRSGRPAVTTRRFSRSARTSRFGAGRRPRMARPHPPRVLGMRNV